MLNRYSALTGLIATAAASPLSLYPRQTNSTTNSTMVYGFKDVPVTKDIQYIPCFENFTCTNIEMPLDRDNPDVGSTNIAFIKYAAAKQPAKGDILYNPGGPGGSAVDLFLGPTFSSLPTLLGDEWNIVGMDPRGVFNSGPNLDCFKGQPELRDVFNAQYYDIDPRSEESLKKYFAHAGGFGDWCSQTLEDAANYANTPATAGDLLGYAELLAESQGKSKDEAKVNFYGASYGSALGTTFAQLYPDRVGRFIIDAVVDVEDYYWGSWSQNLLQGDESAVAFFKECFDAKQDCAFYRNDSGPEAIQQRFDAILEDLLENPISVSDPNFVDFPIVLTHMDLRAFVLQRMYNWGSWPLLAGILAPLEQRNGTLLAAATARGKRVPDPEIPVEEYNSVIPKLLIACNDNNGRFNISSMEILHEVWDGQRKLSKYFGEPWPSVIVPNCRNLRFRTPEHMVFKGKSPLHRPFLTTNH